MAVQESRFITGSMSDRRFPVDGIAEYFRKLLSSGVWALDGNLQVTESTGMNVLVGYGDALIEGFLFRVKDNDTGPQALTVSASDAQPRIDRVLIRLDRDAQTISLTLKAGTPAASPAAPALTRNSSVYELSLAQIAVDAGVSAITGTDITDERDDTYACGVVTTSSSGGLSIDSLPVGFSMPWWTDTPPSDKWLFGEGQSLAGYSEAAAVFGSSLPDTRGRVLVGKAESGTFATTGGTAGAESTSGLITHTHSINHDHASVTSGAGGSHTHSIPALSGTAASSGAHTHGIRYRQSDAGSGSSLIFLRRRESGDTYDGEDDDAAGSAGAHTHSVSTSASTTGSESSHTHAVDLPNLTGNSGSTGTGSTVSIVQPSIVCRWIFKVLPGDGGTTGGNCDELYALIGDIAAALDAIVGT